MKWQIKVKEQNIIVDLPSKIVSNREFEATVNGAKTLLRWDEAARSLYIIEHAANGKTFERSLSLRNSRVSKFSGETESKYELEISGIHGQLAHTTASQYSPGQAQKSASKSNSAAVIRSPITGKVIKVMVSEGEPVQSGSVVCIIEAMKMENKIFTKASGNIRNLKIKEGESVTVGSELMVIK